jgi:hypothetical protein
LVQRNIFAYEEPHASGKWLPTGHGLGVFTSARHVSAQSKAEICRFQIDSTHPKWTSSRSKLIDKNLIRSKDGSTQKSMIDKNLDEQKSLLMRTHVGQKPADQETVDEKNWLKGHSDSGWAVVKHYEFNRITKNSDETRI